MGERRKGNDKNDYQLKCWNLGVPNVFLSRGVAAKKFSSQSFSNEKRKVKQES